MKPRHKRAAIIAGGLAAISLAAFLVLNAFESNLVFFFSPSQVAAGEAPKNRTFRVGGMVEAGSVQRTPGARELDIAGAFGLKQAHGRQLLPQADGHDGFYYAKLIKIAAAPRG